MAECPGSGMTDVAWEAHIGVVAQRVAARPRWWWRLRWRFWWTLSALMPGAWLCAHAEPLWWRVVLSIYAEEFAASEDYERYDEALAICAGRR